jgi:hypothetical protein
VEVWPEVFFFIFFNGLWEQRGKTDHQTPVGNHLKAQFSELSPCGERQHRAAGAIIRPIVHKRA